MSRTTVSTPQAPAAIGPYSQAVERRRLPLLLRPARPRPGDRRVRRPDVETQAERAMTNLAHVLDAAGLTFADVVKTTIFLADMADFAAVNAVYGRFVTDPPPARSTVAGRRAAEGRPRRDRGDRPPAADRGAAAAGRSRRRARPPASRRGVG